MSRYARRRDECEGDIVAALRGAGAAVAKLEGSGVPDLAVEFRGQRFLLECKDGDKQPIKTKKTPLKAKGLTDSQVRWWKDWESMGGTLPAIVTTPAEALAAVGVSCER